MLARGLCNVESRLSEQFGSNIASWHDDRDGVMGMISGYTKTHRRSHTNAKSSTRQPLDRLRPAGLAGSTCSEPNRTPPRLLTVISQTYL